MRRSRHLHSVRPIRAAAWQRRRPLRTGGASRRTAALPRRRRAPPMNARMPVIWTRRRKMGFSAAQHRQLTRRPSRAHCVTSARPMSTGSGRQRKRQKRLRKPHADSSERSTRPPAQRRVCHLYSSRQTQFECHHPFSCSSLRLLLRDQRLRLAAAVTQGWRQELRGTPRLRLRLLLRASSQHGRDCWRSPGPAPSPPSAAALMRLAQCCPLARSLQRALRPCPGGPEAPAACARSVAVRSLSLLLPLQQGQVEPR